jgi:N-acetylmuramoyl-L-alanine amidase
MKRLECQTRLARLLRQSIAVSVWAFVLNLSASTEHIVALDIGHDARKGGARSSRGVMEFVFNKKIVEAIYELLEHSPLAHGIIINPEGRPITLYQRTEAAAEARAELFLSVHHDSVNDKYLRDWLVDNHKERYCDLFKGFSVFYSPKNSAPEKSALFARLLADEMRLRDFVPTLHHAEKIPGEGRKLIDPSNGLYEYDDLIVLKTAKVPAALIECGIIANRSEEEVLSERETRDRIAAAISAAIARYFRNDQEN